MEPTQTPKSSMNVPVAILVAGVLVAGAILWTKKPSTVPVANKQQAPEVNIAPVTPADHILGNPNAPIKLVEYSDTSCPFCKIFHPTVRKIMDVYGKDSKVAWVYRHFPLVQIHPNAHHEAEALECANDLGGNDKFWAYTNRLYEITPAVTGQAPNGLDQSKLPEIASYIGLNKTAFNECLASGKYKTKIDAQLALGAKAGVRGTPYSIIMLDKKLSEETKADILKNFEQYRDSQGEYPIAFINDDKGITVNGALPEGPMLIMIGILTKVQ